MMRRFYFERKEDVHGVSGTGRVAEGVEFSNGRVVLSWLTPLSSTCIYDNIKAIEAIHGHGGKTVVVFED